MFVPVFAEVLKHAIKLPFSANDWSSGSSNSWFSKRSTLFSTKRQGKLPPSINCAASSTDDFHLRVL